MTDEVSEEVRDSRPDNLEHIRTVQRLLAHMIAELTERMIVHDQSKLEPPELDVFDLYTWKLPDVEYDSPEYHKLLSRMDEGLEHHYAHNRHHPQHFPDGIKGMNLIDLLEMVCDWYAAAQRHQDGDIRTSITKNMARFDYDDTLATIFNNTVDLIEEV